MISPNEEVLAEQKHDVLETVIEGSSIKVDLPLSNWDNCPIVMKKGSKIGILEKVTKIDMERSLTTLESARLLELRRSDNRNCVVSYNLEMHATRTNGKG